MISVVGHALACPPKKKPVRGAVMKRLQAGFSSFRVSEGPADAC